MCEMLSRDRETQSRVPDSNWRVREIISGSREIKKNPSLSPPGLRRKGTTR